MEMVQLLDMEMVKRHRIWKQLDEALSAKACLNAFISTRRLESELLELSKCPQAQDS